MYDYNFFGDIKIKANSKGKGTGLSLGLFFGGLILMAAFAGYFYYEAGQIRGTIEDLTAELNSSNMVEVVLRLDEKEATLVQMQGMRESLQVGRESLGTAEKIQQSLIDHITDSLPSDAQVLSISANNEVVSLSGIAAARSAIAEFERSIRLSGMASDVRVESISHDEVNEEYSFSMTIQLGGEPDESVN